MAQLERSILDEAREILSNKKLRLKDMMEWSTNEAKVRRGMKDDEVIVHCTKHGVWAAFKTRSVG